MDDVDLIDRAWANNADNRKLSKDPHSFAAIAGVTLNVSDRNAVTEVLGKLPVDAVVVRPTTDFF
eukprot:6058136-Amphidinium_carterae.1